MKKLTRGQLREIGVYSAWDFAKPFWFLTYNAPGRQTMRPGWRLVYPKRPNPRPDAWAHIDYDVAGYGVNHRVHPDDMKSLPAVLEKLGIPYPSGWVKCLGVWMPKREHDLRMVALIAGAANSAHAPRNLPAGRDESSTDEDGRSQGAKDGLETLMEEVNR